MVEKFNSFREEIIDDDCETCDLYEDLEITEAEYQGRKVKLNDVLSFNLDFFPGVYIKNHEEDLGGWIMFRSGIELEYSLNNHWKIAIGYDHRSSGDLWDYNPGMETVKISLAKTVI